VGWALSLPPVTYCFPYHYLMFLLSTLPLLTAQSTFLVILLLLTTPSPGPTINPSGSRHFDTDFGRLRRVGAITLHTP
jgi:hypothetical protein